MVITEWSSGFPYFLQFKSEFGNKELNIVVVKMKMCMLVAQSCPTLCDPTDYSSPGFSVHGILHARILEWVAISFSKIKEIIYIYTHTHIHLHLAFFFTFFEMWTIFKVFC